MATATTAHPAPTTRQVNDRVHNASDLYELLAPIFGSTWSTARAVALAESGGDPHARNVNTDGSVDRGLFQINSKAHPEVSDACAYNVFCATKAALRISNHGTDWTPWTTYKTGAYKAHLSTNIPNADSGFLGTGIGSPSGIENPLKIGEKFFKLVTDPKTWLRLVEMVLGVALLLMGLKSFTGGAVDPVGAATRVAVRAV
jgi:hypothetical protein